MMTNRLSGRSGHEPMPRPVQQEDALPPDFSGTNRMFGRVTISQMASASAVLLAL
jgi:hypothetical protein